MMFCGREGQGRPGTGKKMRWSDVADIVLIALFSPVVYVFVTRAPVLTSLVFSSLLISG
jgi:hypothetical protein